MNREELRKNIGQVFRFFPIPKRDSAIGLYESENNQWLLRRETPDKKSFEFINQIGDYTPLVLDPLKIKNFDAPDILILRGQVILQGSTVRYEPSHSKSASASMPTANLCMSLEGSDQNGLLEIPGSFESFRFCVTNIGETTVRDYRAMILIPTAFTPPSHGISFGQIPKQSEIMLGEHQYAAYEKFMSEPIYKNDTIKIGQLFFSILPGHYIFLWKIRCDDGSFPTETTYGEMKVEVTPLSGLVMRAEKHLGDKR
jgi:hypothetical protein